MNIGTPPIHDNLINVENFQEDVRKTLKIEEEHAWNDKNIATLGVGHEWENFFSTLANEINTVLADVTYNTDLDRIEINDDAIEVVQILTTAEIAQAITNPSNIGRIFVNSDDNSLQFSLDGTTIRTIAST